MLLSKKRMYVVINYFFWLNLLFSLTDNVFSNIGSKFKYIYIGYCLLDLMSSNRKRFKWDKKVICICGVLFVYMFLWGTLFLNPVVRTETTSHVKLFFIYWLLLILSYLEIEKNVCYREFIMSTYLAFVSFLLIQLISHPSELVKNPTYILRMLFSNARIRATFGIMHSNYVGNICYVAIILSVILYQMLPFGRLLLSKKRLSVLIIDGLIWLMMLSASSRASVTALLLFLIGVLWFEYFENRLYLLRVVKKRLKISILLVITGIIIMLTRLGLWQYIWENSNRTFNAEYNLRWVSDIGNVWTGMGFVENGAFITRWETGGIGAFGVATSSLDIYYLYVFCTTGILGLLIICAVLGFIFWNVKKKRKTFCGGIYFSLVISLLYYAFWESIIFNYRFWSSLVIMIVLLCVIADLNGQGKQEIVNKF